MNKEVVDFELIECPVHEQYPEHACPCGDQLVSQEVLTEAFEEEDEPDYESIWEARWEARAERMMDYLDRIY